MTWVGFVAISGDLSCMIKRLRTPAPTFYPRFWSTWMLSSVVSAGVVEYIALTTERCERDTLTQNLQWMVCRQPIRRAATCMAWAGFSLWFLHHIWLDYPTHRTPQK